MRTTRSRSSQNFPRDIVSRRQIALAGVLLLGVMVLAYGYFQQNSAGLYIGLVVILAGVLNGILQIVQRGSK